MGIVMIFAIHFVEAVLHWVNIQEEWLYFACKFAMVPFFLATWCCMYDGRDLNTRHVFCIAYGILTFLEVASIVLRALDNLLNTDDVADECE